MLCCRLRLEGVWQRGLVAMPVCYRRLREKVVARKGSFETNMSRSIPSFQWQVGMTPNVESQIFIRPVWQPFDLGDALAPGGESIGLVIPVKILPSIQLQDLSIVQRASRPNGQDLPALGLVPRRARAGPYHLGHETLCM